MVNIKIYNDWEVAKERMMCLRLLQGKIQCLSVWQWCFQESHVHLRTKKMLYYWSQSSNDANCVCFDIPSPHLSPSLFPADFLPLRELPPAFLLAHLTPPNSSTPPTRRRGKIIATLVWWVTRSSYSRLICYLLQTSDRWRSVELPSYSTCIYGIRIHCALI